MWGPKSSPRGEEGCSLAGDSFLCVSLPYDVLRRLLRGNLRYTANASSSTDSFCARARRGHVTSAGSRGTPVSARRKAGLPLARVAGLGAFASLSCSGSSPELEKGIKRSAGSGAVIVRLMHRQKSGYVSPFAQRSKMTGGRGSIVLACLFCEGFCLLVAASDPPLNNSLAAVLWAERPALYPPASNPTQPISSNIMNGKRVSLPVRKGLAYLQTVADNSRQFGSLDIQRCK